MTIPNKLLPTARQRVTLRKNILGLAVTCVVFVAMAIACVVDGWYGESLKGLLVTGGFALIAIFTVYAMVMHFVRPEKGSLVLSSQGFSVGRNTMGWSQVKAFRVDVAVVSGPYKGKQVIYDRVEDPEGAEARTLVMGRWGGLKSEDLADLMNQWRQHHTSSE